MKFNDPIIFQDGTSQATAATSALYTASIAFTDGDTMRRVNITNAGVVATSKIVGTIRRPDTATDSVDTGFIYIANVVLVATGSFDVDIACLDWGFDDPVGDPNETVQFVYSIG